MTSFIFLNLLLSDLSKAWSSHQWTKSSSRSFVLGDEISHRNLRKGLVISDATNGCLGTGFSHLIPSSPAAAPLLWTNTKDLYLSHITISRAYLVAQMVKNLSATQFYPWVGKIPWRREWQPAPVFLPGEFH